MDFQTQLFDAMKHYLDSKKVFGVDRVTDYYERNEPYMEDGHLFWNGTVEIYFRNAQNQIRFYEYDGFMTDLLEEL